jgi:cysteine desulfurase/selenocysteine lyase
MALFGRKEKSLDASLRDVRADFPILNQKNFVYFDSACQSLRPRAVLDACAHYYEQYSVCAGRSNYRLAEELEKKIEGVRADVAKFVNASRPEEIIFTRNTTEGINLVARSLAFKAGDIVVVSDKEHNSNLVPWLEVKRRVGIEVRVVPSRPDNTFDIEHFSKAVIGAKLVAIGMTSNLDGVSVPARKIVEIAHQAGALVLLDGAQAVPHHRIDVQELGADFIAFSGHKMLGPSGTGVLYGKYALLEKLEPFLVGGETVASTTYESAEFLPPPAKFEAGLQNYSGILGLGVAVNYLTEIGSQYIEQTEREINTRITDGIKDIPGLTILGPADPALRGGIISFYVDGIDSHKIALMLDEVAGIKVRSGQHCVHSWFQAKKIIGSVRASVYFYNTLSEADLFVSTLRQVIGVLR